MFTERVFPRLGRPRVLVEKFQSLGPALSMLAQSTQVAQGVFRLMNSLAPLFYFIVTRPTRPDDDFLPARRTANDILRHSLEFSQDCAINYYIGTPGPRQKLTAQILRAGVLIAYAKLGVLPEARRLVRNEKRVIDALHTLGCNAIHFPHVKDSHFTDGSDMIVTSPPSSEFTVRPSMLDDTDVSFSISLFSLNRRSLPFSQFDQATQLSERIMKLKHIPHLLTTQPTLTHALKTARQQFSSRHVHTGFCHGDFTSWNTLRNGSGQQYAFDWEYGQEYGPALADLFHFARSIRHHVQHQHPARVARGILMGTSSDSQHIHACARKLFIDRAEIPAYFLLYLLQEILRHSEVRSQSHPLLDYYPGLHIHIEFLVACVSHTLAILHDGPRRRVLVSAYACESDKGSEPAVGWNWIQEIAKDNDVWVLTKTNNHESIARGLQEAPNIHLHFEYVDLPRWMSFWKRQQRGVRSYYYLWQFAALLKARRLHKDVIFDVAHHVTFVNDWLWSFLTWLPVPYVWGPIGSHPPYPRALAPSIRIATREAIRLAIQRAFRICDPLYWLTATRAAHVITINNHCAQQFPLNMLIQSKLTISPAIAMHAHDTPALTTSDPRQFRVLFVGRLHYVKCPDLALASFAQLAHVDNSAELLLVGRGPEQLRLERLTQQLALDARVEFKPWQPRDAILELMQQCDIFLYPSVEGGGLVVLEAMAAGLPIVCLNYGGPGSMVDATVGITVDINSRDQAIHDLGAALVTLRHNTELRSRLSENGRVKAQAAFSWSAKRDIIHKAYTTAIQQGTTRHSGK